MLTVPLAILGGIIGLWVIGSSLNIYSQIALIVLIGLAAKNGILIVEFANQLRTQGLQLKEAIIESCRVRLRPILMTSACNNYWRCSINYSNRSWCCEQSNGWYRYFYGNAFCNTFYSLCNSRDVFNYWKKYWKNGCC